MKKTFGIAILLLTSVFLFSCAAQTDTVEPAGTDANGVAYFEWDGQTEKPWIAFRFENKSVRFNGSVSCRAEQIFDFKDRRRHLFLFLSTVRS